MSSIRFENSMWFATAVFVLLAVCISPQNSVANTSDSSSNLPVNSIEIAKRLTFSISEKAWIAQKPTIRVRVGPFPPFQNWVEGEAQGISVDLMRSFCEGLELRCNFFTGLPWVEAIENIGAGRDGDVILTIKHTTEREPLIAFTNDYLFLPWIIFTRDKSSFVGGIEDLNGKTVSVERGFAIRDLIERDFPGVRLHDVKTSKDALSALASGQVDAYIGNLAVGTYLIHQWGYTNIKVASPTPSAIMTMRWASERTGLNWLV